MEQFSQEQIKKFERCSNIEKCLQRLQYDDQLAVATSRLHMKTLSIKDHIYCFDTYQNIYDYSTVIMIRNNFPLKSQFVIILDNILTAGLIGKWEKDLQRRPNVNYTNFEEHAYSMDDFGAIALYLSLILVGSIAAFIAEFIVYYQKISEARKTRHHLINLFWGLCDEFICGRRHYFLLESSSNKQTHVQKLIQWIRKEISSRFKN